MAPTFRLTPSFGLRTPDVNARKTRRSPIRLALRFFVKIFVSDVDSNCWLEYFSPCDIGFKKALCFKGLRAQLRISSKCCILDKPRGICCLEGILGQGVP
jgi:hypothetical protein